MIVNSGLNEIAKLSGFGLGGTKFEAVALGSSATAVAAGNTALGAELSTNGATKKTTTDVTITAQTTSFANDTVRFVVQWTFTGTVTINEFGIFNSNTPSAGVMLLRQVFAAPLNVVINDTLQLTINITAADSVGTGITRVTNAGIVEGHKLVFADLTATQAGIKAIALGEDNGTSLALAASNTALGDEFTVADNYGLARTQETSGPTVSLFTTNVTNDTTQVTSTWTVGAGAGSFKAIKEAGVFDHLSVSTGNMWIRYVFAADLNVVPTDVLLVTFRLVNI